VGVHDPSLIKVGNTYYIFGSHLAAAKSTNLMSWQMVANGVSPSNPLFNNVVTELSQAMSWAETNTLWAADVARLPDGRFYMYYNACRGDSPRSALGVAVANNIEGPYTNIQVMLRSGMWGQPSEDGTIYDANVHPNVVDPHVFFDKNNRLWMIYGSYSGGLFILEVNTNTGLIRPGGWWGAASAVTARSTRLWGTRRETTRVVVRCALGLLLAAGGATGLLATY
jgi:arabinan endo-1,5-alpha-L-arabinosidase